MFLTLLLVLSLILAYFYKQLRRPSNYPPGPQWLPYFGNLLELKKLAKELGGTHKVHPYWAKKYNTKILGLKFGDKKTIIVTSYALIKQASLSEEYQTRPVNFFTKIRCFGKIGGITCGNGELWNLQKNLVLRLMRDLGLGRRTMELLIHDETKEILSIIKQQGSDIRVCNLIAPAVLNMLWSYTTGERFARDSPRLKQSLETMNKRRQAFDMAGGTLTQHPWLRYIAPEWSGYNLIQKFNSMNRKLFYDVIRHHYETWEEGKSDDLIFSLITQMREEYNTKAVNFSEHDLIVLLLDFYMAGSETTSNTLDFAFLEMILHPNIQKKIHKEIDTVLEPDSVLEYSDRQRLPYIEATLQEVHRCHHVTPVSAPKLITEDTELGGYTLAKGTECFFNYYSANMDKEFWGDPEVFRPERFLNENGDRLLTFGLGKRRCPGEILARNCIFFFFVEILRKYEVSVLPGTKLPSDDPIPGITLAPQDYRVKFVERAR